jgi:hypothetical protein
MINILSVLTHEPFVMVQINDVKENGGSKSEITEDGDAGSAIVAEPEATVHSPVPVSGVFPAMIVEDKSQSC